MHYRGKRIIVLAGSGNRFLTYVLLVHGNNYSLIRIDSIPCKGYEGACWEGSSNGPWLRYTSDNTVAATSGDSDVFRTSLYFFSATGDLAREFVKYGKPYGEIGWANCPHLDGWCNEVDLGARRLDLTCTQRLGLSSLNFTNLGIFPNPARAGRPGHIETWAIDSSNEFAKKAYSGFQETIASLVPYTNIIRTGYMHHSDPEVEK